MTKLNPLSKDPAEIERMWYIPPHQSPRPGWLLYSEDFVLEVLQGKLHETQQLDRSTGWRLAAGIVRAGMAAVQTVVMLFSVIPVINWFTYMIVKSFPRNSVGFFLRGCYWKTRLKRLGADTLIDQGVEFNRPSAIEIGSRCHIDRHVLLSVGNDRGFIRIGDHVFLGPLCHLAGRGGVSIGDFAGLAARVSIYSVTNLPYHRERLGELITMSHAVSAERQSTIEAPVTIGEYAIIGIGAVLLPGAAVGKGAIVHAYSEVTESFPPFAIVSGHGRGKQQGWRRPGKLDPRLTRVPEEAGHA